MRDPLRGSTRRDRTNLKRLPSFFMSCECSVLYLGSAGKVHSIPGWVISVSYGCTTCPSYSRSLVASLSTRASSKAVCGSRVMPVPSPGAGAGAAARAATVPTEVARDVTRSVRTPSSSRSSATFAILKMRVCEKWVREVDKAEVREVDERKCKM